jgi:NADH-quinone oxidoreductase subunit J
MITGTQLLFFVFAGLIVASSLGVVAMRNPIHSALNLVVALLSVAGLFAMLEAHFLATVQIIVYAGAIVVLVLFVLMLLNIKVEPLTRREYTYQLLALAAGIVFLTLVVPTILGAFQDFPVSRVASIGSGRGDLAVGTVKAVGELLYTRYVLTFEAASVLIMVAIAGAVMIGKRRKALHSTDSKDLVGE